MIDRRNRILLTVLALLFLAGGVLALLLGAGVFGQGRSHFDIITHAELHRWDGFGEKAYAVAGAVAFVLLIIGFLLAAKEWRRNDGKKRASLITFPVKDDDRGQTTLDTPSLSHALENDLKTIPNVKGAMVGLFGTAPKFELRSVLIVSDAIDFEELPGQFDLAVQRFSKTVGLRPDPVQVTLRFRGTQPERHLQ
jgi:hypothetical protein